jgi:hypothetical protein
LTIRVPRAPLPAAARCIGTAESENLPTFPKPTICGIGSSFVGGPTVEGGSWLRLANAARNEPNVAALPTVRSAGRSESTVNRKLSAVSAFYTFHNVTARTWWIRWSPSIARPAWWFLGYRCWRT